MSLFRLIVTLFLVSRKCCYFKAIQYYNTVFNFFRWQQMETALQERKQKLNNLLMEIETFWDSVNKTDKWLAEAESQLANQQPPSLVEDAITEQTEQNRKLEDDLRLKQSQLRTVEDLSGSLR